ncbi:MAG: FAD-dependent oxidoreductase [Marinobacter sp.]|nr:FAD-dependent oxidoreductase [Marinobacter sp.]
MSAQAPIVVVGTGLAGYSLVKELRKLDKDTPILMITADDGHNYSKPMLSTGFTKDKSADELSMADAGAMAEQLNVDIRTFTTVTAIKPDQHLLEIGDEQLSYSKLVLAWGADVIRLSIPGDGQSHVHSINDLMDYRAFRKALGDGKRVAIMGAGLIGCEFANDLRNGGYEVDVIAPSDAVMPGLLPPQAATAVRDGLAAEGVRFHLETVVENIAQQEQGVRLSLANGQQVEADLVVSAVGLRPRTELAKAAGLGCQRGIVVNRLLQTSAPDVYAMGDCAEVDGHVLLYVLPLMACARALAKTLTGEPTPVSYGTMPVMVKTPCCPTAVCPPPANVEGEWTEEREGNNVRALFKDASGQLQGFAVTGDYAVEKQALAKQVPPLH